MAENVDGVELEKQTQLCGTEDNLRKPSIFQSFESKTAKS